MQPDLEELAAVDPDEFGFLLEDAAAPTDRPPSPGAARRNSTSASSSGAAAALSASASSSLPAVASTVSYSLCVPASASSGAELSPVVLNFSSSTSCSGGGANGERNKRIALPALSAASPYVFAVSTNSNATSTVTADAGQQHSLAAPSSALLHPSAVPLACGATSLALQCAAAPRESALCTSNTAHSTHATHGATTDTQHLLPDGCTSANGALANVPAHGHADCAHGASAQPSAFVAAHVRSVSDQSWEVFESIRTEKRGKVVLGQELGRGHFARVYARSYRTTVCCDACGRRLHFVAFLRSPATVYALTISEHRYRATIVSENLTVAVKQLKVPCWSQSHISELIKEYDIVRRLHHPNVCQYITQYYKEPYYFLVLQYVGCALWLV